MSEGTTKSGGCEMPVPDLSDAAMSDAGIVLLGFQRTKQISQKARKARMAGDFGPIVEEVRARRRDIFHGAVREIHAEYRPLRAYLRDNGLAPRHVIDIGCGQAINDAFLSADFGCRFTLVDIEQTDAQYHGWAEAGSGYASLEDARAFLIDNGTPADRVITINPRKTPEAVAGLSGDLVTSLFSCGFHYPIDEYLDLFCRTVAEGGLVVMDFRKQYLRRNPPALQRLFAAGQVHEIADDEKSKRLLVRK